MNILEIYTNKDKVLSEFDKSAESPIELFASSEIRGPMVMPDEMAKQWLELNYLFSTAFAPNARSAVGEIGGDIRVLREIDGQKYLVVDAILCDLAVRALDEYRKAEPVCAKWIEQSEIYLPQVNVLEDAVEKLISSNPKLEEFKDMFKHVAGSIGWKSSGLPSERFVEDLANLSKVLHNGSVESNDASALAMGLHTELGEYLAAMPTLKSIRKYHKGVPHIDKNDMIRITTPPASGGLSIHTHPGYDDPLACMLSSNDCLLLAAQTPNTFIMHIGGGETQGEHYVMHIPKKYFFEEVKEIVDRKGIIEVPELSAAKMEVLEKRFPDIMSDEIIGFYFDAKSEYKTMLIHPVVAESEYERHKKELMKMGYEMEKEFPGKRIIMDMGRGFAPYDDPQLKEWLMQRNGTLTRGTEK